MILVTGGTGLIGNEVLRRLSLGGVPARALTRDLKKAQKMPGVTLVAGIWTNPRHCPRRSTAPRRCSCSRTISTTWWRCNTTPSPRRVQLE